MPFQVTIFRSSRGTSWAPELALLLVLPLYVHILPSYSLSLPVVYLFLSLPVFISLLFLSLFCSSLTLFMLFMKTEILRSLLTTLF